MLLSILRVILTDSKMAAIAICYLEILFENVENIPRSWLFDCANPLLVLSEMELYERYRFFSGNCICLTEFSCSVAGLWRNSPLLPIQQLCVFLRAMDIGSFNFPVDVGRYLEAKAIVRFKMLPTSWQSNCSTSSSIYSVFRSTRVHNNSIKIPVRCRWVICVFLNDLDWENKKGKSFTVALIYGGIVVVRTMSSYYM